MGLARLGSSAWWGAVALGAVALSACAAEAPRTEEPVTTIASAAPTAAPGPAVDERCVDPKKRGKIRLAVTVDDLPRHGANIEGLRRTEIVSSFMRAFAKHKVPRAYGLVNANRIKDDDDRAALTAWVAGGHPLGNHNFSHADPDVVSIDAYLADIEKNEPILRELMGSAPADEPQWKVYRFPYLRQGTDLASRARIRGFLAERGYRVADVTVDYSDWAYTDPYIRCQAKKDEAAIAALEESALEQAEGQLMWSDAAACELLGRPIDHILLIHAGAFTARTIDAVLARYVKANVEFITFDEAMKDPIYGDEPSPPRTWRGPLLYQIRASRQRSSPPIPVVPDPALWGICR